jgi:hypothetical protein
MLVSTGGQRYTPAIMASERVNSPEREHPATRVFTITPDQPFPTGIEFTRALRVANGGDVKVLGLDDTAPVIIPSVLAGETLPIAIRFIYASGTTASGFTGYK